MTVSLSPPNTDLGRLHCNALRGLAIITIITHNFVHLYPGMLSENEFTFEQDNALGFAYVLSHYGLSIPLQILSFLGHYGVAVFFFLSGYGLVKRYESADNRFNPLTFVKRHYIKLLVLVLPALLALAILYCLQSYVATEFSWKRLLLQASMTVNYLPDCGEHFICVPWWFLGAIMQFYILYATILHTPAEDTNWKRYGLPIIIVVACWAAMRWCNPTSSVLEWMRYNCVGQSLAFSLGIIISRCELDARRNASVKAKSMARLIMSLETQDHRWHYNVLMMLAALLAIIFGSLSYGTWLWLPLFAIIFSNNLIKLLGHSILKPLAWFGRLSAYIYIVHPIVRNAVIYRVGNMWTTLAAYLIITIIIAIILRSVMHRDLIRMRT